ncbi:urotensin-2 [Papio anubis]|uniref:Urotensin-2 n=1 Tax=Mandrillus leucophaeus TaxID=9568 RepID=A0A2K5ZJV5_MANLE|nr:urotensin-2 [Papio anubis]XP_011836793.1 PREDICTED: urotensin-2 isoform X1 [Mandrillus leucophaeus]XP_025215403.1 urotensin-2 isoform X1 [Theropithecus gelada]
MYKLASCCLLFIGFLNPLLSLPLLDSGEVSLQLSAPHEDAPLTSEELERASLLQILPEMLLGAERGDSLRKADSSTNIFNPRGNLRKFQDFSGQDPDILLSHLLARIRKPYKKRETPDCFWKYCV